MKLAAKLAAMKPYDGGGSVFEKSDDDSISDDGSVFKLSDDDSISDDGVSVIELSDDDSTSSSKLYAPKIFGDAKPPPVAVKRKDRPSRACVSSKKLKSSRGSSIPLADRKPPPQYSVKECPKPGKVTRKTKSIIVNTKNPLPSFKVPFAARKSPQEHSIKENSTKNKESLVLDFDRFASPEDERKPPAQDAIKENSKTGSTLKKPHTLCGLHVGVTKPKKDTHLLDLLEIVLKRQLRTKKELQLKLNHVDEEIVSLKRQVGISKVKKDKNFVHALEMLLKKRVQRHEQLKLRFKHLEEEILSLKLQVAKGQVENSLIDILSPSLSDSDVL